MDAGRVNLKQFHIWCAGEGGARLSGVHNCVSFRIAL
jgi:hypothetical protein